MQNENEYAICADTATIESLCGYSIIILHTRLTKSLSSLFSDQFHIWHGLWVDIRLLWHVCVCFGVPLCDVCVCIVRLWVCLAWTLLSLVSWAQWGKNSCQTLSQCVSAAQMSNPDNVKLDLLAFSRTWLKHSARLYMCSVSCTQH